MKRVWWWFRSEHTDFDWGGRIRRYEGDCYILEIGYYLTNIAEANRDFRLEMTMDDIRKLNKITSEILEQEDENCKHEWEFTRPYKKGGKPIQLARICKKCKKVEKVKQEEGK